MSVELTFEKEFPLEASGGPLLHKSSKVGSPLKLLRKICLELTFEKLLPAWRSNDELEIRSCLKILDSRLAA